MFIVSSDCIGGYLYQNEHEMYNNPFMWSVIPFHDMCKLIDNFRSINFSNVSLSASEKFEHCFKIIIDNSINVHYPHNVYSKRAINLTRAKNNNYWVHADKLTLDNYMKRVERFSNTDVVPTFVITQIDASPFDYTVDNITTLQSLSTNFDIITLSQLPASNIPNHKNIEVPLKLLCDYSHGRTNRIFEFAKSQLVSYTRYDTSISADSLNSLAL